MTDRAALVRIMRVEVTRGHLTCTVELASGIPRMTSCALAEHVIEDFPNLPRHACVNERGRAFADVMACTPVPHLLEHMIVDLQVHEMAKRDPLPGLADALGGIPLVGTSEWLDEAAGLARIDVSFADDLVALRALRDAVTALDDALAVVEASRTFPRNAHHQVG